MNNTEKNFVVYFNNGTTLIVRAYKYEINHDYGICILRFLNKDKNIIGTFNMTNVYGVIREEHTYTTKEIKL